MIRPISSNNAMCYFLFYFYCTLPHWYKNPKLNFTKYESKRSQCESRRLLTQLKSLNLIYENEEGRCDFMVTTQLEKREVFKSPRKL